MEKNLSVPEHLFLLLRMKAEATVTIEYVDQPKEATSILCTIFINDKDLFFRR